MNRKANLANNWVEYVFLAMMVMGVLLALSVKDSPFSYVVILISGFLIGKLVSTYKKSTTFPLYMIIFGFLLGYVSMSFYSSRPLLIAVFVVSSGVAVYMQEKGIIPF